MYEKTCYKNPFIKEAIMRFDFPSPIPNIEKGLPQSIFDVALNIFPIFEPQKTQTHTHELQIGIPEEKKSSRSRTKKTSLPAAKTTITENTVSIFHSLEKDKTLTIAANVLSVQVRRYTTFDQFMDDTLRPLNALCNEFPEIRANRIGLRYVNILNAGKGDPLNWTKYINSKLLGLLDFHNKTNLSRAFQMLEYNFNEDTLKFQVGIANPDYPAKIMKRQFILDIDASSVGVFDYQEMAAKIKIGHERIQELFESSITEATRTAMKDVQHVASK